MVQWFPLLTRHPKILGTLIKNMDIGPTLGGSAGPTDLREHGVELTSLHPTSMQNDLQCSCRLQSKRVSGRGEAQGQEGGREGVEGREKEKLMKMRTRYNPAILAGFHGIVKLATS